ncbi:MAG: galactose mutarotase [Clostridia bacterium]|nr:galactose mutarotase [Clostridia bacterium]
MYIKVEPFGQVNGKKASLYTLKNASGAFVQITDFSGAVVRIDVPDKKGNFDNVVLGFKDVKNYVKNDGYLGALIGPVGNRISNAKFTFDGKEYAFEANENGTTLLHSGAFGFHTALWDAECEADENAARLILKAEFPNEKTGFPGNLKATVVYTFDNENALTIDYKIESDSPSFASPTNHTYFNLGGMSAKKVPSIERQTIEIFADYYTRVDANCIPIENAKVDGTPFDLRFPVKIQDGHQHQETDEQMKNGSGYDHNFILTGEKCEKTGLRFAARVTDKKTGRIMKVYTDMPAMQFYAGNMLSRYNAAEKRYYKARQGLCLETQFTPDSVNNPGAFGFDTVVITPEAPFTSTTKYVFDAK